MVPESLHKKIKMTDDETLSMPQKQNAKVCNGKVQTEYKTGGRGESKCQNQRSKPCSNAFFHYIKGIINYKYAPPKHSTIRETFEFWKYIQQDIHEEEPTFQLDKWIL